jgi:tryptophan halogenase
VSERDDTPFWKATKQIVPPEDLRERLRIWKSRLPVGRSIYQPYHGFEFYSWAVMLLGVHYEPVAPLPILDHLDPKNAHAMFRRVRQKTKELLKSLPSQYEYLTQMRDPTSKVASATRLRPSVRAVASRR